MKARDRKNSESHAICRLVADDMPLLRSFRESTAKILKVAKEIQNEETDPAMMLAAATVVSTIQGWYDDAGRNLDLLERTPPAWRP